MPWEAWRRVTDVYETDPNAPGAHPMPVGGPERSPWERLRVYVLPGFPQRFQPQLLRAGVDPGPPTPPDDAWVALGAPVPTHQEAHRRCMAVHEHITRLRDR